MSAVLSKLRAEGILEVERNHFHLKSSWKVVSNVQPPIPFDQLKRENDFYLARCVMSAVLSKLRAEGILEVERNHFHLKSSWKVVSNVQPPIPFDQLKRENDFYLARCVMSAVLSKLRAEGLLEVKRNHFYLKSSWKVV